MRCPCGRAGLPVGAEACGLCDFDEVNGLAPTVRPPSSELCGCGRIAVDGHRCQACADRADRPGAYLRKLEVAERATAAARADWRALTDEERAEAMERARGMNARAAMESA